MSVFKQLKKRTQKEVEVKPKEANSDTDGDKSEVSSMHED